jgi:hypothetical protein
MAKSKVARGARRGGAAKIRSQIDHPITGAWTKRDGRRGEFVDVPCDPKPFKGVRKVPERKRTAGQKIVEGLTNALAFSRIQKLIEQAERERARQEKVHPGMPTVFLDCRIHALKDAQALFGRIVRLEAAQ